MNKYLVLYKSTASSQEQMANATPEQMKEGMAAWKAWATKAAGSLVEMGSPLGSSLRVANNGSISDGSKELSGYSIMQAKSGSDLVKHLEDHPHFMAPGATIEIHEMMAMPGA